ncbi:TPA: hypothetical protein UL761_000385 [Stenotrophomonas maltophilia]|nr:hypothetical protein [Stenotrophomonas maltophilia]
MIQPWEKRLKDLWLILERCHETYMEPELFRLNLNQFLTTSRTVTFIVQKHKTAITNFSSWYDPIAASWGHDEVMNWAKDSRNKIEKEGDLDLHSSLDMTLFWSYLVENDTKISTGRHELLQAGTKRLVRLAQKQLPSGMIKSSAVRIERRWVANSLPNWELLHAFNYIYSTLHEVCREFSFLVGSSLNPEVPDPSELQSAKDDARRISYLKLSDLAIHSQVTKKIRFKREEISDERMRSIEPLKVAMTESKNMDDVFDALCNMATSTFEFDGYHVPMMFFYGNDMRAVDMMSLRYSDRVDKYILWREAAERMIATKAKMVVAIGEAWIRDLKRYSSSEGIDALPIIGERLFVTALDISGNFRTASWEIYRDSEDARPSLQRSEPDKRDNEIPFHYAPILHRLGIPYPKHIKDEIVAYG